MSALNGGALRFLSLSVSAGPPVQRMATMTPRADPTWAEGFEAEPLSDEEDVADAHGAGDQVDAAFYDPLSEENLVR